MSSGLADAARAELRRELPDVFAVRPGVYWADLLASAGAGWACFAGALRAEGGARGLLTLGAILLLLRALVFLHEIAHGRGSRGFERCWNLAVGVPLCVPSAMYATHGAHHRRSSFATRDDPEYAPVGRWSRARRLGFCLSGLLVPVALLVRWGVVAPLSLLSPRLRRVSRARLSTLAINPDYRRPTAAWPRRFVVQEWGCAAWVWGVALASLAGAVAPSFAVQWLAVVGGVFLANQARTLAAHGYRNPGRAVGWDAQFADSIDLRWSPLSAALAPLGLRRHALHHLLPELPYHSLGRAHRHLARRLPPGSPYRRRRPRGLLRQVRRPAFSIASAVPPMRTAEGFQWRRNRRNSARSTMPGGVWARSACRPSSPPGATR